MTAPAVVISCRVTAEHTAYVALYRALECDRRGFLRDNHLADAREHLVRAGLPELTQIADDAIGRTGGSDADLLAMLHALGEGNK